MRSVLAWLLRVIAARRARLSTRLPPTRPSAPGDTRQVLWTLAALLPLLAAAGFFVVVLGLIPIKASPGHWAVTEWFLQFAKRRAVIMQSMTVEVPPLDDETLVLKGAGHYEGGCRPCHGAPGAPRPAIPMHMTPAPPDLSVRAAAWEPDELFHMVWHGIKFTGMPAWPAERREDEVWAVVAFLLKLPGLGPEEYRHLVRGDAAPMRSVAGGAPPEANVPARVDEMCGRCHGREGLGRGASAFPRLAGQRAEYLRASLEAYANGQRFSGIMAPIASGLPDSTIREIAEYYARLPPGPPAATDDRAAVARGARIAREGVPEERIPSCRDCHATSGSPKNPAYPVLDGQYAGYLALQLRLFTRGARGGSPYAEIMHEFAHQLSEGHIGDVALYYASRGAGPGADVAAINPE